MSRIILNGQNGWKRPAAGYFNGFDGYKVHSKICLITYRSKNEIKYITQIGTGNYNEKTAKLYMDYSLMTANQSIGEDAAVVF